MKAVRIHGRGGPEVLRLEDVPDPLPPGPGEVRVRVRAVGLNRADLLQAKGLYPAPPGVPADIPGLEFSGEIVDVGPGEGGRRFAPGARVMGLLGGGAFSELLVTRERELLPMPPALDFPEAAAFPEAFATAYDALSLQGGLTAGQHVLVHAVASGVGTAAVQLCLAAGATPLGTTRSAWKLERAQQLTGLLHGTVCADSPPRFARWVRELTLDQGAALCLELAGGAYLPESLRALAPGGLVMLVGLLAGTKTEIELSWVLTRRLGLRGTTLRSRSPEEKATLTQRLEQDVLPLLEAGRLRPVLAEVMPMAEVARAAERMGSNELVGKLVLAW